MRNYKIAFCFILIFIISVLCECIIYAADVSPESNIPTETTQVGQDNSGDCFNGSDEGPDVMNDVIIPVSMEFLGAFLGILAALALDRYLENRQYKELNCSLHQELRDIYDDLSKHDKLEFYRYLTPVWDIYLASGQLALLVGGKIRREYLDIYSKIQYAQELEQEYIHSKLMATGTENISCKDDFRESYIKTINEARNREASDIMKKIEKLTKE